MTQNRPSSPAHQPEAFEVLLEHSKELLAFLDPAFNFVRVNRAYALAAGRSPEDLVGKNHFALYPDEENLAIFQRARDSGEAVRFPERPFVYPDQPERGTTYWDWVLTPLKGAQGGVTGLVLSLQEVTHQVLARRQTEQLAERLREREERYRELFEYLSEGFAVHELICDAQGQPLDYRFLAVNPAFERLTGLIRDQVLGRTYREIFPGGDRFWIDTYAKVAQTGEPTRFARHAAALGRHYEVFAFSPRRGQFATLFIDDTERRRAEEQAAEAARKLQIVADFTHDWEHWRSEEDSFLYVSPSCLRITGYHREELLADPALYLQMIHPEDRERVAAHMRPDQLHAGPCELEFRIRRRDGEERWIGHACQAVLDAEGRPHGRRASNRDITNRKRLEQERERHLAAIEEANQAKDLFFNTLSHELRSPLAAMVNAVHLLQLSSLSEEQRRKALGILERNVRYQTRLIDDLLDLSRILRGKLALAQEALDLRALAQEQLEAAEAAAREAGVQLRLELPAEPMPVLGDAVRLAQVLFNLLGNAIKFTEAGGTVALIVAREGAQARVRVRDNGIGIPPRLLPQIFEVFRQGEDLARTRGGLGIGLAVSRSLAERHGGELTAFSAGEGRGAEFTLSLPLQPAPPQREAPPPSAPTSPRRRRVLIIEDSVDQQESLALILRLLGHEVLVAADGASGLELARSEQPDLALIDLGLPDLDGFEVARRLRAAAGTRGLRLVAVTGYASPEHRERALAAGFDEHLPKPLTPERLQQLLAG